ncbi:LytR/AlgR family response regulator transcription factor [Flagellimonas allohymeniacidonis]|uniref:Response regulator transcription factor n=1 Tax=Flagellimonas allohymeniacidonis TaxID=2517819 RepID=A0A4Q8QDJ9_9FLAO|nr:LytTR family DNA-binding domain-containing protein [Allomuricauda hymeniacidonis]TAI48475.1 response regulator transcription factor [Allomuricauda hymeniacidonis]
MKITNKTSLKVGIVEDNQICSSQLKLFLLEEYENIKIVGEIDTVGNSDKLFSNQPDLVFLDIKLPDGNAFDILEKHKEGKHDIIFVTAYDTYFQRAFEHYAFNYLLKPLQQEKIKRVMDRYFLSVREKKRFAQNHYDLSSFISKNNSKLLLNLGGEHIFINIDEIVQCQAEGNYTQFLLNDNKKYLANNTLKYFTELLGQKGFFRANRKVLININHIRKIKKGGYLVLKNNEVVLVSIRNRNNLNAIIQDFS